MTKKKNDGLWIPALIICSDGRWLQGWVDPGNFNERQGFKLIIDEKYHIDQTEILAINNALVKIGSPTTMSVN